jgi:galactose mutarotase-like enzyme
LLAERAVPASHPDDAMHIAVATVNGMDFIVTWNFSHINNPFTRMMIRHVLENAGYVAPEICSPDELLRGEI